MTEAHSETADFGGAVDYQLLTVDITGAGSGEITSFPAGIECGGVCKDNLIEGPRVSLMADADPASVFAGWSGACSGTGTCTVTMTEPQSVSARFEPMPTASFILTDLVDTFTGTAKRAVCIPTPEGLPISVTYDGFEAASSNAGHYPVVCTSADPSYQGSVDWVLIIAKAAQIITFGTSVNAGARVFEAGKTFTVSAAGGGSGQPVEFSSQTTDICTVDGSLVSMLSLGLCSISPDQADDDNFAEAETEVLEVLLDWDADEDGTPEATDPDDDNDGMGDAYEVTHGLDPFDADDATKDKDKDGFDNRTEHDAGTDPSQARSNPRASRVLFYQNTIHGAVRGP